MTVATLHPAELEPVIDNGLNPAIASLVEWAEAARAAHQIAVSLVKTSFVPAQFRDKPEEATAAILAGGEVGLSPMASLRSFDIIQGVAAPRALTLRAVVQAHGHEVWEEKESATEAKVCGRRAGSTTVQSSTWTLDRASRLGLTGRDQWKKQPQAMLVARATSEVCRRVAADAILGIPYSSEELADAEGDTPAPRKRVKRAAPVTPEPSFADEPPAVKETPEEIAAEAATDQGDEPPLDEPCQVCGGVGDHDIDLHDNAGIPIE
jgi:hypothetical protein